MGTYVPDTKQEQQEMLREIGFNSFDEMFSHIPEEVKLKDGLNLMPGLSEQAVIGKMEDIAGKNVVFRHIFRGAGAYNHYIPAIVSSVISKEEFVTAYTPYQAEISQAILQSIFEYQTMICELTGMDASNASIYDGATAAAEAAAMCRELYVVISWCRGRESTSKEMRYRCILNSTRHLPNVMIRMVEDQALTKEEYDTPGYWEQGARDIKAVIGKPIDAVFCGTDYLGTGRFEALYGPESQVIYFDRSEVPVCSTDIRAWALGHWDYIPSVCRDYYARRVLVLGSESTGKSTLVRNLALAYNTNYVSEAGRDTCDYAGGEDLMIAEDLYENLLRQKINVMEAAKHSNRILFVDTDAVTTLFYSHFLLGDKQKELTVCTKLAEAIHETDRWDLVLFLEPDVEFIQDGTRNEKIRQDREGCSLRIKELLDRYRVKYHCIGGTYLERFNRAKELIQEQIGLVTVC